MNIDNPRTYPNRTRVKTDKTQWKPVLDEIQQVLQQDSTVARRLGISLGSLQGYCNDIREMPLTTFMALKALNNDLNKSSKQEAPFNNGDLAELIMLAAKNGNTRLLMKLAKSLEKATASD